MASAEALSSSPNHINHRIFNRLRESCLEFLPFFTIFITFLTIPGPHNSTILNEIRAELESTIMTSHPYLLPTIHDQFHNIISKIKYDFLFIIKDLLLTTLNTTKQEHADAGADADAATILQTLNSLMAAVSRFTDETLYSIALNASATLRELSLTAKVLDKQLDKAKLSAQVINVLFSTLIIGCAAAVSPVVTVGVAPLLQITDPLFCDIMEKPIKEKQKVIENISIMIYFAIVKVGTIKDMVQDLNKLVAKPDEVGSDVMKRLEEVRKAVDEALAKVEMVEMVL